MLLQRSHEIACPPFPQYSNSLRRAPPPRPSPRHACAVSCPPPEEAPSPMPNLDLVKKTDMSAFRKIALGTWQTAYDPSIYGSMKIRMDKALRYIEAFREKTGKRITITHLVAKATASALEACPDANAIVRWNRIYLRKTIDTSILVLI